jgi:hypothetical protein
MSNPDRLDKAAFNPNHPPLDYRDFQRTTVILSGYRSGSHFLKLSLANLAQMQGLPEPLNTNFSDGKTFALPDYLKLSNPLPNVINQAPEAFHVFLSHFYKSAERVRRILFDLKYSHAFTFGVNCEFDYHLPVPTVIDEFRKLDVPFIHLVRKDVISQAVSLLVAESSGVYLTRRQATSEGDEKALSLMRLSPKDVLKTARRFKNAQKHFDELLFAIDARFLRVSYEDLIGPQKVDQFRNVLRFIGRYADVPEGFRSPTRPQSSRSSVINMDDIIAYVEKRAPELL